MNKENEYLNSCIHILNYLNTQVVVASSHKTVGNFKYELQIFHIIMCFALQILGRDCSPISEKGEKYHLKFILASFAY